MSEKNTLLWDIAKHGTKEQKQDLLNQLIIERNKRLESTIEEVCDELAGVNNVK